MWSCTDLRRPSGRRSPPRTRSPWQGQASSSRQLTCSPSRLRKTILCFLFKPLHRFVPPASLRPPSSSSCLPSPSRSSRRESALVRARQAFPSEAASSFPVLWHVPKTSRGRAGRLRRFSARQAPAWGGALRSLQAACSLSKFNFAGQGESGEANGAPEGGSDSPPSGPLADCFY